MGVGHCPDAHATVCPPHDGNHDPPRTSAGGIVAYRAVQTLLNLRFPSGLESEARERNLAGVTCCVAEVFLDAQQLVVLGNALAACRSTGLDLAAADGNREVGDGGVLGLAGTVAHHRLVAVAVSEIDGVEGLGQGADLVDLHQECVGRTLDDAFFEALGVGDEEVVADELDLVADLIGECDPAVPVVFVERILDGNERVASMSSA